MDKREEPYNPAKWREESVYNVSTRDLCWHNSNYQKGVKEILLDDPQYAIKVAMKLAKKVPRLEHIHDKDMVLTIERFHEKYRVCASQEILSYKEIPSVPSNGKASVTTRKI